MGKRVAKFVINKENGKFGSQGIRTYHVAKPVLRV